MSRTRHIIFWASLCMETAGVLYFLYSAWLLWSGRSHDAEVYPERYRKVLIPAGVLFLIIASSLVARYKYKKLQVAFWLSLTPVWAYGLALAGMLIASMFIHDWR